MKASSGGRHGSSCICGPTEHDSVALELPVVQAALWAGELGGCSDLMLIGGLRSASA